MGLRYVGLLTFSRSMDAISLVPVIRGSG